MAGKLWGKYAIITCFVVADYFEIIFDQTMWDQEQFRRLFPLPLDLSDMILVKVGPVFGPFVISK